MLSSKFLKFAVHETLSHFYYIAIFFFILFESLQINVIPDLFSNFGCQRANDIQQI